MHLETNRILYKMMPQNMKLSRRPSKWEKTKIAKEAAVPYLNLVPQTTAKQMSKVVCPRSRHLLMIQWFLGLRRRTGRLVQNLGWKPRRRKRRRRLMLPIRSKLSWMRHCNRINNFLINRRKSINNQIISRVFLSQLVLLVDQASQLNLHWSKSLKASLNSRSTTRRILESWQNKTWTISSIITIWQSLKIMTSKPKVSFCKIAASSHPEELKQLLQNLQNQRKQPKTTNLSKKVKNPNCR